MLLDQDELRTLLDSPVIYKGKGGLLQYKCKCPQCGYPEFYISIAKENHPAQCWRKDKCGYSANIYGILKLLNRFDLLQKNQVHDLVRINNQLRVQEDVEIVLEIENTFLPVGYKRIYESDYLSGRGFAKDTYLQYEVGISKIAPKVKNDYFIFPVKESGQVKGYVARHFMSKQKIDFHNSENSTYKIMRYRNSVSEFSKLLYGIDDVPGSNTVVVVEGIFDKISVDNYLQASGLKQIIACVCSFGSSITIEQVTKMVLLGVNKIVLFYDEDAINKVKQIGNKIGKYFPTVRIEATVPTSSKDPGDSNFQEIEELLLQSRSLNMFQIEKIKNTLK